MLKNIETTDKVIIQKMVQLPIDIAAEVLKCYCTDKTNVECILLDTDGGELCPFRDTHCRDITVDMWEEYLNG